MSLAAPVGYPLAVTRCCSVWLSVTRAVAEPGVRRGPAVSLWLMYVVTGAFGYSGKYIAKRLLDEGQTVSLDLTNSTRRANPFGDRIIDIASFISMTRELLLL